MLGVRPTRWWLVYLGLGGTLLVLYVAVGSGPGVSGEPARAAVHGLIGVGAVTTLYRLIRRREPDGDPAALIDSLIVSTGAAMLTWAFLIASGSGPQAGRPGWFTDAYQPAIDLAVITLAIRLMLGAGARPRGFWLLMSTMLVNLATNLALELSAVHGGHRPGVLQDAGRLVVHLLVGATALHPAMTRWSDPGPARRHRVGAVRLAALSLAMLATLCVLIAHPGREHSIDQLVLAATSCAMLILVLARMIRLVRAAETAAITDGLTGLSSRDQFVDEVRLALARSRRGDGEVAVLFIDVDRFKAVNDALGHNAGDELLVQLGLRLQGALGGTAVAGRQGGDEFTVLLRDLRGVDQAREAAERLRSLLSEPLYLREQRIDTSVSIGLALDTDPADDAADLLRHADAALHLAKAAGRNRVEVFKPSMREAVRRRLSDESEVRDALSAGQFVAWYQPIVDMRSGRIVAAEALVRWNHPERGLLLPGQFLPIATEAGLIAELSAQVAVQAMDLRRQLAHQVPDSFRISFNLGVHEVTLPQVIDVMLETAAARNARPQGLTLELTETAVINDLPAADLALARARQQGFAIALDDFGTGFSSLSLLRDLPLDVIKIDRTFTQRMADSPVDAAIIECVLELARQLGFGVVVEGVETFDEVEHLLQLGAAIGQGFLYSTAVPPQQLRAWLGSGGGGWTPIPAAVAVSSG